MRIIAGSLGGRSFNAKGNATHPMSDKIRGALFNSLGDIEGLRLLDAFSGTGAISFEAISRGAAYSVAVESNKIAQKNIDDNIRRLDLEKFIKLYKSTVINWINNNLTQTFDLIICDPPYNNLQFNSVLSTERVLKKSGLLVISLPAKIDLPEFEKLKLIDEKTYGDSRLVFYRNNQ